MTPPSGAGPFSGGQSDSNLIINVELKVPEGSDSVRIDQDAIADSYGYDLGRSVGDSLGLDRSESQVTVGVNETTEFFGDFELSGGDIVVQTEGRISERSTADDGWVFAVDGQSLARVATLFGFAGVDLTVCTPSVPTDDQSSVPADSRNGDCHQWIFAPGPTVAQAPEIRLVQAADTAGYWSLVGLVGLISVLASVITGVIAGVVRRRKFPHLNAGAVGMVIALSFVSLVAWVVTSIVFGFATTDVFNELALAHNLGDGGSFVATVAPSFLPALPWLVAALVFARARALPPVPELIPVSAEPGVEADRSAIKAGGSIAEADQPDVKADNTEPPSTGSGWQPPA